MRPSPETAQPLRLVRGAAAGVAIEMQGYPFPDDVVSHVAGAASCRQRLRIAHKCNRRSTWRNRAVVQSVRGKHRASLDGSKRSIDVPFMRSRSGESVEISAGDDVRLSAIV